jgi:hypothetical protein
LSARPYLQTVLDARLLSPRYLFHAARTPGVTLLIAAAAVAAQGMDLLTGVRLMVLYGLDQEQNPIARSIFQTGGPVGLVIVKLGVVLTGVAVLLLLARAGRRRLARTALVLVALLGLVGCASNLV